MKTLQKEGEGQEFILLLIKFELLLPLVFYI